ncbi:MAG TPA: Trm112 family protein [Gemmatimonadaceae bacterium]|jgi:uncharacterized protein YbaR (Trm112 family)
MSLSPQLLKILVCPKCKGELEYQDAPSVGPGGSAAASLVCPACRLRYPVRDGIPIMLVDEATPL